MATQTFDLPTPSVVRSLGFFLYNIDEQFDAAFENGGDVFLKFIEVVQGDDEFQMTVSVAVSRTAGGSESHIDLSQAWAESDQAVTFHFAGTDYVFEGPGSADNPGFSYSLSSNAEGRQALVDAVIGASDRSGMTVTFSDAGRPFEAPGWDTATGAAQTWHQNDAITAVTVPAVDDGFPDPTYAVHGSSLPAGLTFNTTTRVISGTPTGHGSGTITIRASNDDGSNSGMADYTIAYTITQDLVPTFGTSTIANIAARQGTRITTVTLPAATSGNTPRTYSISPALPTGLVFRTGNRRLLGTPTGIQNATTYTYTVRDNDGDTDTLTFTIAVEGVPYFGSASVADQSWAENSQITPLVLPPATRGDLPLTYSISPNLPAGLSFDASTRTISGTPSAMSARRTYTYTAEDNDGDRDTLTFRIEVEEDLVPTFGNGSVATQSWTKNVAITDVTVPAATSGNAPLSYSISPALPTGLTFTSRVISGTPTVAHAARQYTVTVTDSDGDTDTLAFNATVTNRVPTFGAATVADQSWKQNAAVTDLTIPAATGGDPPLDYSISPALPRGMSFNAGTRTISGTPRVSHGARTYTVTARDSEGDVGTISFSATVAEDLAPIFSDSIDAQSYVLGVEITPLNLPAAVGGDVPIRYSLSPADLPRGLTLSRRVISGTPTELWTRRTYVWAAADADNDTDDVRFTLEVTPRQGLTGDHPVRYGIVSGPPWIRVVGSDILGTAPDVTADRLDNVVVRAVDSSGQVAIKRLNILTQFVSTAPTDAVGTIRASDATTGSVLLSWSGVAGATTYDVEINGTVVSSGQSGTQYRASFTRPATLRVRVRGKNADGNGPWSSRQNFSYAVLVTAPTVTPQFNRVTDTGGSGTGTSATAHFNLVSGATSYDIEITGTTDDDTHTMNVVGTTARYTYSFSRPATVRFRARARNSAGVGPWSGYRNYTYSNPSTLSVTISGATSVNGGAATPYRLSIGGTATGTITFSWSVTGNGTITGPNDETTCTVLPSGTAGSYTVSVTITRGGRSASDSLRATVSADYATVDISLGASITWNGAFTNGTTVWAIRQQGDARAFVLSSGARDSSKDISLGSGTWYGGFTDGTTAWVVYGQTNSLRAFVLSSGARDSSKDISLGNGTWRGGFTDGTTAWVSDNTTKVLRAFTLSDGTRDSSKDIVFTIIGGFIDVFGAITDGATAWVIDDRADNARAYVLSTGARDSTKDFNLGTVGGFSSWRDGFVHSSTAWIVENGGKFARAFPLDGSGR